MADMFAVYSIIGRSSKTMDFETVCSTYPEAKLDLLKSECISIVAVYNGGEKVAVINRLKEVKEDD